jgi:hypothetical protein
MAQAGCAPRWAVGPARPVRTPVGCDDPAPRSGRSPPGRSGRVASALGRRAGRGWSGRPSGDPPAPPGQERLLIGAQIGRGSRQIAAADRVLLPARTQPSARRPVPAVAAQDQAAPWPRRSAARPRHRRQIPEGQQRQPRMAVLRRQPPGIRRSGPDIPVAAPGHATLQASESCRCRHHRQPARWPACPARFVRGRQADARAPRHGPRTSNPRSRPP